MRAVPRPGLAAVRHRAGALAEQQGPAPAEVPAPERPGRLSGVAPEHLPGVVPSARAHRCFRPPRATRAAGTGLVGPGHAADVQRFLAVHADLLPTDGTSRTEHTRPPAAATGSTPCGRHSAEPADGRGAA
ncbi:hypothetical protein ACN6AT_08165 [Streptomyces sp. JL4002]|uniref:hypothetical protein n=1 Tax=Streptomyces TaxID=1883 RepID=UPI003B27EE97